MNKSPLATQIGGAHYKSKAIQPVVYNQANKLGFCEGNIVKYATRHGEKGKAEDVRKIIHYAKLLLELEYGEAEEVCAPHDNDRHKCQACHKEATHTRMVGKNEMHFCQEHM